MSKKLCGIGPVAITSYPLSAWERLPKSINLYDVWKLCGPTVEKNMDSNTLWKVFCIVYLEGMAHGVQSAATKESKND